jgi:molybdate/tungstate transport system permease protein
MTPRPVGGSRGVFLVGWLVGSLLIGFILAPLIGLAATQSPGVLLAVAAMPDVREAIGVSLVAALLAAVLASAAGVPLAYVLARGGFRGQSALAALIDLPLAVPHTVAGIALLLVFGRRGMLGGPAEQLFGLRFWGSFAGVVVGMLFVSAPYTVNAARLGFEAVDPRLEQVARTLGVGPWRALATVTLPLAWRSVVIGMTLTFARAISEFAAVAILAYYPMSAPVKIYEVFLQQGLSQSAAVALLLLVVSLALFLVFRLVAQGRAAAGIGR